VSSRRHFAKNVLGSKDGKDVCEGSAGDSGEEEMPTGLHLCQRTCDYAGNRTNLDELCARREKFGRIVDMFDYFHCTNYVETLRFLE
jgi:hypothetical protein